MTRQQQPPRSPPTGAAASAPPSSPAPAPSPRASAPALQRVRSPRLLPPLHDFVWLASQSPRRAQLLAQLGVAQRPLLPAPDEDAEALEATRAGEAPADYVRRVTLAKLRAARRRLLARGLPPAPIVAADTTVALRGRIHGKPADAAEAASTLAALSGRWHQVLTAVAVSHGSRALLAVSASRVLFGVLSPAVIRRYVASGEPFGKAGAYALQGPVAAWVERVDGSPTAIIGLPLFETRELLARARVRCEPITADGPEH